MGMFDTVHLRCPNCKEVVEEQTKSGPCMLNNYTIKNAPMDVMAGIIGSVRCYHCATYFKVEMVTKPTFKVRALTEEEQENGDEMDMSVLQGD